MTAPLRVVVTGLIGHHPLGGMTWHYVQYVAGLRRLGYDVYYVEDTGKWPYDPARGREVEDCDFAVNHVAAVMSRFGAGDRWAYRSSSTERWYGLSDRARAKMLASADLLLDVSGSLGDPGAYRRIARLAYIDTDPVFTQIGIAGGRPGLRERADAHDVHFSFGERIAESGLSTGHHWRPTRQPILLDEWHPTAPRRDAFTTVMNWKARSRPAVHDGQSYGQKDEELARFLELPALVAPIVLELAANAGRGRQAPHDVLRSRGWQLVDPEAVCLDFDSYRRYIESSAAEWSVAKNGYVRGQPGWFSERSACYLAAGRPVVAQDTGFSTLLPVGEGLLPFTTLDEAAAAVREVAGAHRRHAAGARAIAEEYFDSDKVLARLVEAAFASEPAARARAAAIPHPRAPSHIEVLRENRKSAVYRLDGSGLDGAPLIVKRCRRSTGRVERVVYEELLPHLPLRTLAFHGYAEDGDTSWLFLECAAGETLSLDVEEHRQRASWWLAQLHGAASRVARPPDLPERGPGHYLSQLRSARAAIGESLSSERISSVDREMLSRLMRLCDFLESRWQRADECCAAVPSTLVHGDLQPKNLRVRTDISPADVVVIDWETAGWGAPAADVAASPALGAQLIDASTYFSTLREHWPTLRAEPFRRLIEVGKIFGLIAAIEWDVSGLGTTWPQRSLARIRDYHARLVDAAKGSVWAQ